MDGKERLEAFERMLADVQTNYAELASKLEKLKNERREKSATFRQYLGNKLTFQYMLSMYEDYGLIDRSAVENGGNKV